jgi:hypothetical protein
MPDKKLGSFDQLVRFINEESNPRAALLTVGGYNDDVILRSTGTVKNVSWTSTPEENFSATGMILFWDVAIKPPSGTVQLFVDARNPATMEYTAIYQTAVFHSSGTVNTLKKYLIYPGAVDDASLFTGVDRIPMPHWWRVRVLHSAEAGAWDYSVGASYLGA